ncbi:restriction endonuclease subunit S [Kocuria sp. KRD140]|uniref:restriction endonuclease subunit S n=1 Tax=Kocuria sp. KRD140 TaxID=2729723 RepID=UPI0019D314F3
MNWSWTEAAAGRDGSLSLPAGWTQSRVGHVSRIINGMPYDSKYFGTDGEPLIRIRDLSTTDVETRYNGPQLTEYRVSRNTLLVGMDGEFNTGRWRLSEPALLNQRVLAIESGPYWSKWLEYCLPFALNVLNDLAYSTTVKHLSSFEVARVRIPTPPEGEMKKIANYLDHETAEIDALIKQLAEVKTLISDRRRTIIDNSFAHAACPEVALKYLGVLHSGLTLGKRYEVATQKYPYLRVANVQAGYVDLSEVAEIDVPPAVASENRLEPNDVLLTEGGDRDKLGRGALWKGQIDPVLHQNHVFAFRCNSKLLPEYLVYALESTSARIYFDQTARQSTNLASTNSTVVRNFKFPAPPTVDQHSIVERLDHEMLEMQEMLANSNRVIDLARERRAALITAAVTGQIDVTAKNKPAAEQLEDDVAQGLHREYA